VLVFFTLKNPQRGAMDAPSPADHAYGFKAALAFIVANGALLHLIIGPALLSAGNSGVMGWSVSFLIREHGFSIGEASFAVGVCQALGAAVGILFTGLISDKITKGAPARIMNVILAFLVLTIVGAVAFVLAPTPWTSLAALAVYMMSGYNFLGLSYGAILNLTPAPLRGTVLVVELVAANLVGYAGGPMVVGFLSDVFGSLRYGMLALVLLYVWGIFHFLRARTLAARIAAGG
jgi:sugar phosphate permease